MDTEKTTLKIRTHNINGFNSSDRFLFQECDSDSFSILALQEHWLKPSFRKQAGTNKLKVLHPRFDSYATSGMTSQIGTRILKGRPYGGTGFLFNKKLSRCIRARVDLKNDRVTVLELNTVTDKILLINAYMPYYNTNNNPEQLINYRETLAFIENIMISHPLHKFILLMDMNCNIYNHSHPYSSLMNSMMARFDLVSSFSFSTDFDVSRDYTRFDLKRNSFTLIDGILISKSLSHIVDSCRILHPHDNVSDHLPVEISINVEISGFLKSESKLSTFIPWSSLSNDELSCFRESMLSCLNNINVPWHALNHGSEMCDHCDCVNALEGFYRDIVSAVEVADRTLPRRKHGLAKPYWSPELTALKQRSLDAHILWKNCSCPHSGPIHQEKIRSNYQYKKALRDSKNETRSSMSSQLSRCLLKKDKTSFWQKWKQNNGSNRSSSSMINGFVDTKDIADSFADMFKGVYKGSDANSRLKSKFEREFVSYTQRFSSESLRPHLFTWPDMVGAVSSLKVGKATSTFIKAEHIFNGCPELLYFLHLLFNGLLCHSYLPFEFLCGTITPIIKDPNGDASDSSNYRGITLGPIFGQVFEYALFEKFGGFLVSDDLQFGYKRSHSTSHAIYVLKTCVDYYREHGSNVLVTFLDCTKAFDTISHYGIFLKLMERNVPLCFLGIMMYWYLNMQSRCRWGDSYSDYFHVPTGTKQGGVISPRIFTLYMDELIRRLRKRGIGCHMIDIFIACLMYADDMCLLAPSRGAMQEMLKICEEYCLEFCLSFNVKKSKSLIFSDKGIQIGPLLMYGEPIEYVPEWNYLGATIVAGTRLAFSCKGDLAKFYRSINSLLSATRKPNESILMHLLYFNCVPNLTYVADMQTCNIALNNAIRRIYSYDYWDSTRSLRQRFGFSNIFEIYYARQGDFRIKSLSHRNSFSGKKGREKGDISRSINRCLSSTTR